MLIILFHFFKLTRYITLKLVSKDNVFGGRGSTADMALHIARDILYMTMLKVKKIFTIIS